MLVVSPRNLNARRMRGDTARQNAPDSMYCWVWHSSLRSSPDQSAPHLYYFFPLPFPLNFFQISGMILWRLILQLSINHLSIPCPNFHSICHRESVSWMPFTFPLSRVIS